MLARSLSFLTSADCAGIVLGTRMPSTLTGRGGTARSRLAFCAAAVPVVYRLRPSADGSS